MSWNWCHTKCFSSNNFPSHHSEVMISNYAIGITSTVYASYWSQKEHWWINIYYPNSNPHSRKLKVGLKGPEKNFDSHLRIKVTEPWSFPILYRKAMHLQYFLPICYLRGVAKCAHINMMIFTHFGQNWSLLAWYGSTMQVSGEFLTLSVLAPLKLHTK